MPPIPIPAPARRVVFLARLEDLRPAFLREPPARLAFLVVFFLAGDFFLADFLPAFFFFFADLAIRNLTGLEPCAL